jgi:hypothetical protein
MKRGVGITLALAAASFPLAGCGGGASSAVNGTNSSAAPSASASSSAAAAVAAGGEGGGRVRRPSSQPVGRDIVSDQGAHHIAKARGIGNEPNDEVNASGAKTQNPCTLVSASEAQAIIGKPVGEPTEAPQGPTCIYRPQGATSFITLAVESKDFSKIEPQSQLHGRMSLTVDGHAAYCGTAGAQTLIVPLPGGKFMAVSAPCPLAASFAAKALSRL